MASFLGRGIILLGLNPDDEPQPILVDATGKVLTSGGGGGGAPTDATYVTTSANGTLSAEAVLGTDVIMSGTVGARPAAGTAGRLYWATDENILYRDSGATWVKVGTLDLADMTERAYASLTGAPSIPTAANATPSPVGTAAIGSATTEYALEDHVHAIPDQHVTSRMVNLTVETATVATSETTTSTSLADLATAGPTATPSSGATQDNLVMVQARVGNSTAGGYVIVDIAVAGADPGDDTKGILHKAPTQATAGDHKFNCQVLYAAKASGTAYKARYKVSANTGTFIDRDVIAAAV